MGWEKTPKHSRLEALRGSMQALVEAEIKKTESTLERFIKVLELKQKHELAKKTHSGTTT